MLGRWEYRAPKPAVQRTERPALGAGLIVELEIDSVIGEKFSGRVVTWFAGDMGTAATMFDRVIGEVGDSGAVRITIPFARENTAPIFVAGVRRGDTITITSAFRREEPGPFATTQGSAFVRQAPRN
jgi:hypothetical protein